MPGEGIEAMLLPGLVDALEELGTAPVVATLRALGAVGAPDHARRSAARRPERRWRDYAVTSSDDARHIEAVVLVVGERATLQCVIHRRWWRSGTRHERGATLPLDSFDERHRRRRAATSCSPPHGSSSGPPAS